MAEYLRVRDKQTRHEYTIRAEHFNDAAHERIDKPALDHHGEPAPMKPRTPLGKAAGGRQGRRPQENDATPEPAPIEPTQEENGQTAETTEENS